MNWIIKGEESFMYVALIVMSVLAFVQVVTRYVFELPNAWIEETTRYLMVWLIFVGMAIAARKKAHLEVDVISFFFPSVAKKAQVFFNIILLVFGLLFGWLTWKVVSFQWEMGQTSPGMQLPMAVVYLGMLVGGILFVIHLAVQLYGSFSCVVPDAAGKEKNQ